MKKTLSILLSLLMVLGTMTCLFTMPVTTASAEEAATPEVETLPVTDIVGNKGLPRNGGVITPTTEIKLTGDAGVAYPTSTSYGITGWNAIQSDSYIEKNTLYQFTFDVTVSDDVNENVTLRPVFQSQDSCNMGLNVLVGVRTDKANDVTDTAYNYVAKPKAVDGYTTFAQNSATLAAGKTYTYTYLFNTENPYVNHIRIAAEGLTAGTITVGTAKIFPYAGTDADNFYLEVNSKTGAPKLIPFNAEENGNVFARVYGYRAIGDEAATSYSSLSAKVGGELYNLEIKGGKTYELNFDIRVNTAGNTLTLAPAYDFYEVGALNYTDAYASIKDASDTTNFIVKATDDSQTQRTYSNTNNGYSYFYSNANANTRNRRIYKDISKAVFYDANGTKLSKEGNEGTGSGQGRYVTDILNAGWINANYSLNAMGQTLEEASTAGFAIANKYDACMRYRYVDGKWEYNSAYKSWYVPAAADTKVAVGMDYLYKDATYDFDNFTLNTTVEAVPVEYKNAKGEADNSANTVHTTSMYFDVLAGKTYANINLFENDALVFDGWYNGDELVSTDVDFAEEGIYDNLKAVIVNKNLLTNAGGFENYSAGTTNLEADFVELKAGQEPYPNYTGGEFRYYKAVPPTGDKWTGSDSNIKLSSIKDNDNGVTTAKIIADIEATGDVINDKGVSGFTYFKSFPTVVTGTQSVRIYGDAGTAYGVEYVPVVPYNGNKMLRLQTSSRTGFRALEGLTAGKTYTLSFYAYNPYAYYYLKDVVVTDGPMTTQRLSTVKTLASYTTPTDVVTEDVRDKDGNVTKQYTGINKAKPEYVQNWYKVELTFTANANTAYLGITNQNRDYTGGYAFIDELAVVEYDCNGNHVYDNVADITCNACGEARVYPTAWDFEDGSMENIVNGTGTIKVVDAADQPAKIGSKYLEYASNGWTGIAFNFPYEQGYKYTISYDFKIFTYGTGKTANGIDHVLSVYDNGEYGGEPLNKGTENIITRYWENGQAYQKVASFSESAGADNNFVGRVNKDGVYIDEISSLHGGKIWDEWQHVVVEIGTNNDYDGLVEYGIRPNDSGWVVGVDNFKVEKIALTTIEEADNATNGTYAFNIRARTAEQKQGLRFKSTIDLDALNLADGAKIVEYGTLAMKAELLDQGFILERQAAKDKAKAGHVVAGVAYNAEDGTDVRYALDETTNTLTYTGVLTGIGVKNYGVSFAVRGYAIVELADGTRTTVYDDVVTLSVYEAAQQIVEANTDANDVAVAQTVIDNYNAYVAAQ